MRLNCGVALALLELEEGVVAPERAGVPESGRRLEMMPVVVRLSSSAGVELPSSSYIVVRKNGLARMPQRVGTGLTDPLLDSSSESCSLNCMLAAAAWKTLSRAHGQTW